jgi:hypothetical protein
MDDPDWGARPRDRHGSRFAILDYEEEDADENDMAAAQSSLPSLSSVKNSEQKETKKAKMMDSCSFVSAEP